MDEKYARHLSRTRAVSLSIEANIDIKPSGHYLAWEMHPRRESEVSCDSTASRNRHRRYKVVIPKTGVLLLDHNTSQLFP